eukprot:TRINITY_DN3918_c0_g1_i1.p1 TRINITY_DN3918_c0_g1~~TRINITY_DN3918_c0_g1_i1.p1  ORF type:complete len:683 (-),score=161.37 TRINITY_DN3918_c0_g1_i1:8-2056(-)
MSERLKKVFAEKKAQKKAAFVAFTTAGYPTLDATVPVLLSLEAGGADIIELGVPHSDPIADGPTIQEASTIALKNGITWGKTLSAVKEARAKGLKVPVVLMGYTNPFYAQGLEKSMQDASEAGIDGVIAVDLPPEESSEFRGYCKKHNISFIPLVAPVTSHYRLSYIDSIADTFVYCVSLLGVTGARDKLPDELPAFIRRVRKHIKAPLAIGFGISSRESFVQVSKLGDGIVVGSSIVKALTAAPKDKVADAAKEIALYFTTPAKGEAPIESHAHVDEEASNDPSVELLKLPANFGDFGGRYAPEVLIGALEELEHAYAKLRDDPGFQAEIRSFYDFLGRPTPLYYCERLSKETGGAQIWLKREDLCHTGAHKINNAIGQALIAKRLGKTRIIAETGAGQHGVATATICAKLGLECVVYMGSEDIHRQSLNVFRMKILGAKVIPVESGSKTLKDAINEAMRDWVTYIQTTHYLIGSAVGPHPFPTIVRDFQSVIGKESRQQFMAKHDGKLPDLVVACVGGGSNSIGMFHPFINDKEVRIVGVEAAGHGEDTDKHCATLGKGTMGVLHGTKTFILQDSEGQIAETHSVSAGLDYPGVGPEHAFLKASGRAEYVSVSDKEALQAFQTLTCKEGIIPALESSHAVAYAVKEAARLSPDKKILVCLSGRGDKDMGTVAKEFGISLV